MKKNKVLIGVAIAVVAAAIYLFIPKGDNTVEAELITSPVETMNIVQSITATGTVEPVTVVDVGTQVSGILTTLYVDYNSVVKEGQVIAELDKSTLTLTRDSKKNSLMTAEASLKYQTSNYKRVKALFDKGLIADDEHDSALYSYEQAKNNLAIAKNDLEQAEINLGYATIYSPINGVVLSRSVEEGQTVASSFSTPTLFEIAADLRDMRVIADVDEADIGDVTVGQKVEFSVDAYPGVMFEGFVTQVRQEAIVENNVTTYEVVISAANPDLKLKPGLTANVEVFTLNADCEKVVPAAALSFTPEAIGGDAPAESAEMGAPMGAGRPEGAPMGARPEGAPMGSGPMGGQMGAGAAAAAKKSVATTEISDIGVVWVQAGDHLEPRNVKIGITNGIETEIIGSIRVGDEVVIGVSSTRSSKAVGSTASKSPFVQQRPGGR